jgi:ribosomal protein S18 acetylase RimI-like enzyme
MNPAAAHDPQIGPVSPERQAEALRLVFSRLAEADRQRQLETFLAAAPGANVSLSGLLGASRRSRLVGAVFSQIQPGRTALLWPPRIVVGESAATAARLLETACGRLARQQICMVQALLETDASPDAATLLAGGFDRLAKLFYLVSPEVEFPSQPPWGSLDFEYYSPANHPRLARVVEATYGQTLDCPRLNGVRQIEDVLTGYRATGVFDPERWLIVRHDGRDVGCLLLADHPKDGNFELVYMGLAASVRGRGWGTDIARQAQWRTRQAGRARLVLAVDTANQPALKIYTAVGFRAWDRRSAYVKVFRSAGS